VSCGGWQRHRHCFVAIWQRTDSPYTIALSAICVGCQRCAELDGGSIRASSDGRRAAQKRSVGNMCVTGIAESWCLTVLIVPREPDCARRKGNGYPEMAPCITTVAGLGVLELPSPPASLRARTRQRNAKPPDRCACASRRPRHRRGPAAARKRRPPARFAPGNRSPDPVGV
jgi:hypothetical protein